MNAVKIDGITTIFMIAMLCGCQDRHPQEPFFSALANKQDELSAGEISFLFSEKWPKWSADGGVNIDRWGISSPNGKCDGTTSDNPIHYTVRSTQGSYVLVFGGEIECRVRSTKKAKFILYPIIEPRPLFDPDDVIGAAEFFVILEPQVE